MQHVFAGETAEAELSVDAVVEDGDMFGRYLGGRYVQGRIGRAVQFPGKALEPAFGPSVLVEGFSLDAEDVSLAGDGDAVVLVRLGGLSRSGVHKGAGDVVHKVEVCGGEPAQGSGVTYGNLNGVYQHAVVSHFGHDFYLLHLGRRLGAASCNQQCGPKEERFMHIRW